MQKNQLTSNTIMASERTQTLASHRSYIGTATPIDTGNVRVGDVIRFMYNGTERTVFVLNPDHDTKLHGLSMNAIDRRTMMVEVFAKSDLYVSPTDFYAQVISRDAVKSTDSYRTYVLNKVGNLRRVEYQVDERGREEL